jgi:sugar phosphate isomerase/epimerase
MIGIHLHDISGITDHLPPGKGELDFSVFLKYLPKDALIIMEAHNPALAQDLVASKKFLEGLGYGR